ncbi:MAG: hypothetical protein Kow00121_11730 [Elainellaceae cyanobacterium]
MVPESSGFQYAKLNPNSLASATTNGTEAFLATFWQNTRDGSTAMRQAIGKLDDLFAGLETKEERLKLLKFETNLLKATYPYLYPYLQLRGSDVRESRK